jgi:hypothetical protein
MLFYGLAAFNLFWIIFTIITCEYTLQYNHIQSVLGENGRIFFPSQLIPFAVGICGLIRVAYLYFESWRSSDHSPSLGRTPSVPKRALTVPRGKEIFKLLAPATKPQEGSVPLAVTEKEKAHFDSSDLDEEMMGRPLWWRILVAYLPWLQPVVQWWRCRNEVPAREQDTPSVLPREKLEHMESRESDIEHGDSSDDGRRRNWDTENT